MKLLSLALCTLLFALATSEKARYDNYRVYELVIENEEQLELLQQIENNPDGYRLWDYPGQVGQETEIVVPPHKYSEFGELVEKFELKSKLMINNLQEVIDNEQPKKTRKNVTWTAYANFADIMAWMDTLVAQYPHAYNVNVGNSHEGRAIRGVRINIGGGQKNQVVLEGTMHAREWISTATTCWILNELLTSTDAATQQLAQTFEWIIIPVTNPDGYVYTWTTDRMWRKTRRPSNALCFGADPNRNWGERWNQGGASTNPCSETYAGPNAFSEPESRLLSEYLTSLPRLSAYFAFHAYGQMMMTPYGWTNTLPPNYQTLYQVGDVGRTALTAKFGTQYSLGSIANVIYIASGSSVDWVLAAKSVNLTYAYEFRDTGSFGFSLPASQIINNSIEVWASVAAIMNEALRRGIA